jgi:hypothetical protein
VINKERNKMRINLETIGQECILELSLIPETDKERDELTKALSLIETHGDYSLVPCSQEMDNGKLKEVCYIVNKYH